MKLIEDLQADPEENIPLFMYLLVESLIVLDKVPEAVEAFKGRIKRDMMMVIRRATDQVAKRFVNCAVHRITRIRIIKFTVEMLMN